MTATLETPLLNTPTAVENRPELGRRYTVEEYFALPDDGHKYELADGLLVEKDRMVEGMPGPSIGHGNVISRLNYWLLDFQLKFSTGIVSTDAAFTLKVGEKSFVRRPDVAFLSIERADGINLNEGVSGPPDLAIEVISTTDIWSEIVTKVREYQAAGTKLTWVVDPFGSSVFVYHQNQITANLLGLDKELDGENVIEGFKLRVGLLFE